MPAQPKHPAQMTADELARATAAAMYENDACSRALGLEIVEVRPGYARLRMAVRDDFLNGHQICHGGLIFTLADSTFAFACNTYNINTVAAGCSIEFLRPVKGGDVLTAPVFTIFASRIAQRRLSRCFAANLRRSKAT
jgi:acyl-CoA thioesterase